MIGLIAIALAILATIKTNEFLGASVPAEATVTELVPSGAPRDSETTFKARARFLAPNGQAVFVTSAISSRPPAFEIGQRVPIRYVPADPNHAEFAEYPWVGSLIGFGLGLSFMAAGLVTHIVLRKSS